MELEILNFVCKSESVNPDGSKVYGLHVSPDSKLLGGNIAIHLSKYSKSVFEKDKEYEFAFREKPVEEIEITEQHIIDNPELSGQVNVGDKVAVSPIEVENKPE